MGGVGFGGEGALARALECVEGIFVRADDDVRELWAHVRGGDAADVLGGRREDGLGEGAAMSLAFEHEVDEGPRGRVGRLVAPGDRDESSLLRAG